MIADRIKRLVMLIVIATPIVFGGLAINAHLEVSGFQRLIQQDYQRQLEKEEMCKALSDEQRSNRYLCSYENKQWSQQNTKSIDDGLIYWRELEELYTSIATFVPLVTLAVYIAGVWVWVGKIGGIEAEKIKNILLAQRGKITLVTVFVLGGLISYSLWPDRMTDALIRGGIKGLVITVVVWGIVKLVKK
jgi:hypothetical protein